ncbi:unnamed protein product, partial [Rotaria magnacalcarata]
LLSGSPGLSGRPGLPGPKGETVLAEIRTQPGIKGARGDQGLSGEYIEYLKYDSLYIHNVA